ncbi:MAG TPA: hypothetical protein VG985_01935 [Xanthobacteraceae bacterium]|nr:hypothetical protein [Xanthobacteraceae bacterium]
MTHHHHGPGEAHPSPCISPSLLRMSAAERLAIVAATALALWLAVLWAVS